MEKSKKEIKNRIFNDLENGHFNHAQKVLLESKDIIKPRLYHKLEKEIELCFNYKGSKKVMRYVYFSLVASLLNGFLWITLWIMFFDFMESNILINIIINSLLLANVFFIDHLISRFIKSRMGYWNYWNKFSDWGGIQLILKIAIILLTIRGFFR